MDEYLMFLYEWYLMYCYVQKMYGWQGSNTDWLHIRQVVKLGYTSLVNRDEKKSK